MVMYNMDSEEQIFWTFFITTMCGFILTLARQAYKSKCSEVHIGCIHIKRDIYSEVEIDELQSSAASDNSSIKLNNEEDGGGSRGIV